MFDSLLSNTVLPLWVLFSLSGVVLAVGGTLFDKYLLERYFGNEKDAGPGALLIFSAYFSIFIIAGILFVRFADVSFNIIALLYALVAGILNGVWILLYLHAIHRTDVSKAAPIFQTIPAFGLVVAFFTLGEVLTTIQIFSIATLMLGSLVLVYERKNSFFTLDWRTLFLMIVASAFVAISQAVFKISTQISNYFNATFWLWFGFLIFGLLLHICVSSYRSQFNYMFRERIKSVFTLNSANEVFDSVGELFLFAAVMIGPIALVQSLGVYEPLLIFVVSAILATIAPQYFKEDITKSALIQKTIGILIVLVGSIILYSTI